MSRLQVANQAIQAQKNIDLNKAMNQLCLSTEWFYFNRIKDTGLSMLRDDRLKDWAADFDVTPQTLKNNLTKMIDLKWAFKTKEGYVFKSWKKVALRYGIEAIKVRTVRGKTKEEMRLNHALVYLKQSQSRQVYEKVRKQLGKGKVAKLEIKRRISNIATQNYTINSCRGLVRKLGLKGAMAGSRILRKLEKLGFISIKRNYEKVCNASEYWLKLIEKPSLEHYCFLRGSTIYKRTVSNINIK